MRPKLGYLADIINERLKGASGFEPKYTRGKKVSLASQSFMTNALLQAICEGKERLFRADRDGRVYAYMGTRWMEFEQGMMTELVRRLLVINKVGVMYHTFVSQSVSQISWGIIKYDEETVYAATKDYIGFTNGVLSLKDGKLKPLGPKYMPYLNLAIPYNAKAGGVLWRIKLEEIIPDKGMRAAFQMFCGALLADRREYTIEYMCYLYGDGANGKSVLARAIAGVLGRDYVSNFTPYELFKEGSSSMFNRSALKGKVLNVVDDLDDRDNSGGAMKKFISGEEITARAPHDRKYFVIDQPPYMLCCANRIPQTGDDSHGHHRKQLIIQTTKEIFGVTKEMDPTLGAKLAAMEMQQVIFNWIYEGYKMLVKAKGEIKKTPEMRRVEEEVKGNSSSMRLWYMDRGLMAGVDKEGRWMAPKELYKDYRDYCYEFGYLPPRPWGPVSDMLVRNKILKKKFNSGFKYYVSYNKAEDGNEG